MAEEISRLKNALSQILTKLGIDIDIESETSQ